MDEDAFSTAAFSTDAWSFFGAIVAGVTNVLMFMRRRMRR